MNSMRKMGMMLFGVTGFAVLGFADTVPAPMATAHAVAPDAPLEMISPGRYSVSIMPGINGDMGGKLEKAVDAIPGLEKSKANSSDSTLHFTIKDGAKVPVTTVQNAITKTDADAAVSAPLLEHSLSAAPGL